MSALTCDTDSQPATPREVYRLVFRDEARGVPGLQRGWRTPDPSPVRTEGLDLPRCKAKQVRVVYARGDRSRDCSPSTPRDNSVERIRTPSPDGHFIVPPTTSSFEERDKVRPDCKRSELARTPLAGTPPAGGAPNDYIICDPGDIRMVPSTGSIGHPTSCAEPCKYFSRARGCKDGAMCDRCHLCEWRRQKASTAEPATCEESPARRPARDRKHAKHARGAPSK